MARLSPGISACSDARPGRRWCAEVGLPHLFSHYNFCADTFWYWFLYSYQHHNIEEPAMMVGYGFPVGEWEWESTEIVIEIDITLNSFNCSFRSEPWILLSTIDVHIKNGNNGLFSCVISLLSLSHLCASSPLPYRFSSSKYPFPSLLLSYHFDSSSHPVRLFTLFRSTLHLIPFLVSHLNFSSKYPFPSSLLSYHFDSSPHPFSPFSALISAPNISLNTTTASLQNYLSPCLWSGTTRVVRR